MFKKLLALSLAAVILSVTAFASTEVVTLSAAYAADIPEGLSALITVAENNAEITENGLGGYAKLTLTSNEAKAAAIVVTAVFDGEQLLDAEISDGITLEANVDKEQSITIPAVKTTANSKYTVKFYLWESKDNLVPLAECETITVTPAVDVWSGEVAETLSVATASDLNGEYTGYYMIKNGEDLAKFASLVNGGETTAKAVLCNDIYLNGFFKEDGSLDSAWYENSENVASAESWNNYMIGTKTNNYAGTFDGNGNSINGMYLENVCNNSAMFAYVNGATIKNFKLKDMYISAKADSSASRYIGALTANVVAAAATTTTINNADVVGGKLEVVAGTGYYIPTFGSFIANFNSSISDCKINVTGCDSSITLDSSNAAAYTSTSTNAGVGGLYGRGKLKAVSTDDNPLVVFDNCSFTGCFNVPGTSSVCAFIARGSDSGTTYNGMTVAKNCTADFTVYEGTAYDADGIGSRATGTDNSFKVTVIPATATE